MKWVPKTLVIDSKQGEQADQANEETKESKPQKPPSLQAHLEYDSEWISILKAT